MPINSFIAHPKKGKIQDLIQEVEHIAECEIIPSTNREVIVLVTDTKDKAADIELQEKLNGLQNIAMLSMVSGFDTHHIK